MTRAERLRWTLRSAYTVGRRDFMATVMSKVFLLFLLAPLFPLAVGLASGSMGERLVESSGPPKVAVVADEESFAALEAARERLGLLAGDRPFVELVRYDAAADPAAQREALLAAEDDPVVGVLEGGLESPHYYGATEEDGRVARTLATFVETARHSLAQAPPEPAPFQFTSTEQSGGTTSKIRELMGLGGQMVIFVLVLLLAGMIMSQMLEEKGNKVIEVLASSIPVDAIFLGKLFAMLAISLVGITVWIGAGIVGISLWLDEGLAGLPPPPAVGWTAFVVLLVVYFAMNYLLIGAAFLGIGAQASTVREVQTLSMPISMGQIILLFAAQAMIGAPTSTEAIAAAVFPLTSPLAMIAFATQRPEIWPHLAAIAWQGLWVVLILKLAARFFRRSVMKSGRPFRWPWQKKETAPV
ncbi:ABC transporter permease [Sphingomicrobium clamense]|uniref:ABC transporter permease n=1 Tax=Sphingomicrobium clamense TaxID=2851013 RepID=A0ABS6V2H3_9SPHN|nr:ABC transporter permease [Sphingomicrobium sp. B8]MBW0143721.1 ABC transporter permease [Sphingomicrobium sp. B8]